MFNSCVKCANKTFRSCVKCVYKLQAKFLVKLMTPRVERLVQPPSPLKNIMVHPQVQVYNLYLGVRYLSSVLVCCSMMQAEHKD